MLEETLSLSGAIVVKSFGTEQREAARFDQDNTQVRRAQVAQLLEGQWLSVIVQGLAALGPALLYTYGAYLIINHQIGLGTVVAFATYLAQLYAPASSLAGANATLLGGLALFDRVFHYLDLPISVPEPAVPHPLPATPAEGIAFAHVSFRYPGAAREKDVLHDISFIAPLGQLTALVGPSGAGKSTILSLAARFYDPDGGHCAAGWRAAARYRRRRPAAAGRRGDAGGVPVPRDSAREHLLRRAGRHGGGLDPWCGPRSCRT